MLNCLGSYKTQEMFNKTVDVFPPTLKFVPDWFVTSKMIKKIDDDLFSNYDIIFVSVDLSNINLDDVNIDEEDP